MIDIKYIRNFAIIAHIDHGKSTLADRFIQICEGLSDRDMKEQVLDSMDIERERGITIKAQSVSLNYQAQDGITYQLNLIDTPGHVDFSYEVSRSLASCEGCLLVVDASASVQAQTVANCQTAVKENIVIIPVLNKIDLPAADAERCLQDLENIVKIDVIDHLECSAKNGIGVQAILEAIVQRVPHPQGAVTNGFKARIVDSWFDNYLGVVSLVRVYEGILSKGQKVKVLSTQKVYEVQNIGIFTPKKLYVEHIHAGQVGFIVAGVKSIGGAPVGDTLVLEHDKQAVALDGFQVSVPQVFAGMFPIETEDFASFRLALEKLALNDASLTFQPAVSHALGHGFHCGFLGVLHMAVIRERLEREYALKLIVTSPSITYKITLKNQTDIFVDNPSQLEDTQRIDKVYESMALVKIIAPAMYLGNMMSICNDKSGIQQALEYSGRHIVITYEMPMIEVISNLADKLKSASRGYASFEYAFSRFLEADIAVLRILINDREVDVLSQFVRKNVAVTKGRVLVEKLVKIIPSSLFTIKIQAALGAKIIARDDIKALRKDVTGKCYGGDITRKKKLLEKQKAGKKRMKSVGSVNLPEAAFAALLGDEGL